MRKIPYLISFLAVLLSFSLSFMSLEVPEWLATHHPEEFSDVESMQWGLYQLCKRVFVHDANGRSRSEFRCQDFPSPKYHDCAKEVNNFCVLWETAGYTSQMSLVFAAASLFALIFITSGFGTHARRRTAWQGITILIGLHGALQIATMAIVVHLHRKSRYPTFRDARLASSFYLNTVSWILDICIIIALIYTAFAAKSGKRWAAGRSAYQPIPG